MSSDEEEGGFAEENVDEEDGPNEDDEICCEDDEDAPGDQDDPEEETATGRGKDGRGRRREGKGGGKSKGKSKKVGDDPKLEDCVKKQVEWLNGHGFDNSIGYRECIEEVYGLTISDVHDIMDKLRDYDKTERVKNPTAWICNAFKKRKRWLENGGSYGSHGSQGSQGSYGSRGRHDSRKDETWLDRDVEDCVRKQIGWLNSHGFDNTIGYREVAEAVHGMDINDVHEICDKLRDKDSKERINNPTAWLCNAFTKRRQWKENEGSHGSRESWGRTNSRTDQTRNSRSDQTWNSRNEQTRPDRELESCVKRQVGRLNKDIFENCISYREVMEEAFDVSVVDVEKICDQLREFDKKERVANPTGWLRNAIAKRRQAKERGGTHSDTRGGNQKRRYEGEDTRPPKRRQAVDENGKKIPPWRL